MGCFLRVRGVYRSIFKVFILFVKRRNILIKELLNVRNCNFYVYILYIVYLFYNFYIFIVFML